MVGTASNKLGISKRDDSDCVGTMAPRLANSSNISLTVIVTSYPPWLREYMEIPNKSIMHPVLASTKVRHKNNVTKQPLSKRLQFFEILCEGSSMRSISRITDLSINTVSKILVDAGEDCLILPDEMVHNVKASRIQCDEIWSYCYAKDRSSLLPRIHRKALATFGHEQQSTPTQS
jgi:hypothetical protein